MYRTCRRKLPCRTPARSHRPLDRQTDRQVAGVRTTDIALQYWAAERVSVLARHRARRRDVIVAAGGGGGG